MLRVFMVLEDYSELMFLQTVLKKIGFDVDGVQNSRGLNDHILSMNPDILLMTAHGKKINGFELAHSVRRSRGLPRVILVGKPEPGQEDNMMIDGWVNAPVATHELLSSISDLCGLNRDVLLDKLDRLQAQGPSGEQSRTLRQTSEDDQIEFHLEGSSLSDEDRASRYEKFLQAQVPKSVTYSIKEVREQVKVLRQQESAADLADLEQERKEFVKQLFKKDD